jgi:hypothetical protein
VRPSQNERDLHAISETLHELADRMGPLVEPFRPLQIDPSARFTLAKAVGDLRRLLPGLGLFGNPEAACVELAGAQDALTRGHPGEALVRAIRGLACSPHHPELHYAAAAAALENGAVAEAVLLLRHTLWLKPGHVGAQSDLAAMFESGALEAGLDAPPDDARCRPAGSARDLSVPPGWELIDEDEPPAQDSDPDLEAA